MSTARKIERAIEKLNGAQVEELRAWLFNHEILRDVASGMLDS